MPCSCSCFLPQTTTDKHVNGHNYHIHVTTIDMHAHVTYMDMHVLYILCHLIWLLHNNTVQYQFFGGLCDHVVCREGERKRGREG